MSDETDLSRISGLETRITSALERISQGVAAATAIRAERDAAVAEAAGLREAADAAQAGAETSTDGAEALAALEAEKASLQAALEETQSALESEQKSHADLADRLRALEEARRADRDEAARQGGQSVEELTAARAEIASLTERLSAAETTPAAATGDLDALRSRAETAEQAQAAAEKRVERLEHDISEKQAEYGVLSRQGRRIRGERNQLAEERDRLQDEMDEMERKLTLLEANPNAAVDPEEMRNLRSSNLDLRNTLADLRAEIEAGGAVDGDLISEALKAELQSLKAERASEAAEAQAILQEMRPMLEGGSSNV